MKPRYISFAIRMAEGIVSQALRSTRRLFVLVFLPLVILMFVTGYPVTKLLENREYLARDKIQQHNMAEAKLLAESELTRAANDLQVLTQLPSLMRYLSAPTSAHRTALEHHFLNLAQTLQTYVQIRFIDVHGMERIRVDHQDGVANVISDANLQDKSSRYYVRESMELTAGEVYLSRADLNVEHGAIEQPLNPVVRLASPVFDQDGNRQGILVINYRLQWLLDRIRGQFAQIETGQAFLVSQDGDYLISAHPGEEWGALLGRAHFNYARQYPDVWSRLQPQIGQQQLFDQGLDVLSIDIQPRLKPYLAPSSPVQETTLLRTQLRWHVVIHRIPVVVWQSAAPGLIFGAGTLLLALVAWLAASRLVAQRRHVEQITLAAREAEAANQAKSRFLANMSHELRTPMNAILGFGQLMEYDRGLPEEHQESVQEILKAGRHLLALINDVLDLTKIETGHMSLSVGAVELSALLPECIGLMQPLADQRGIRLINRVSAPCFVQADRMRLKQIVLNLLSNAVKYNQPQGQVVVSVDIRKYHRLRLNIEDTGAGISADDLQHLFQPFTRAGAENSAIEGTGIGLTLARQLIELMGGTIGVQSQPGAGSCFWIELPLEETLDPVPPNSNQVYNRSEVPGGGCKKILYVDDNPTNIKLLGGLVERLDGVVMLDAHTPYLGLDLARRHHPDLIILDINMPGLDGYQVLEILKEEPELAVTPVMALTANAMHADARRGLEAGFDRYVTKPLDVNELLSNIRQLLAIKEDKPSAAE